LWIPRASGWEAPGFLRARAQLRVPNAWYDEKAKSRFFHRIEEFEEVCLQKHLLFEFFSVGFLEAWPLRGGMVAVEGKGPA